MSHVAPSGQLRAMGSGHRYVVFVVAADLLERALQQRARLFGIAGEPFFIGPHHAARRIPQALAAGIVSSPADERANGLLGFSSGRLQVPPMRRLYRERPCCDLCGLLEFGIVPRVLWRATEVNC